MRPFRLLLAGLLCFAVFTLVSANRSSERSPKSKFFRKTSSAPFKTALEEAREKVQGGDFGGALDKYLWCFEKGRETQSDNFLRLSVLLREMVALGKLYPEALRALHQLRDDAEKTLLQGADSPDAARELIALDSCLDADVLTLAVYDRLPSGDPRRVWLRVPLYQQFVGGFRYQDAVDAVGFGTISRLLDLSSDSLLSDHVEGRKSAAIRMGAMAFEAFAGAGDLEHARAIRDKLVALDSSPDALATLKLHADRAGQPDLIDSPR